MSITYPRFEACIRCSAGVLFDLVADMPRYHRWLPGSEAFGGTRDVLPYPVQKGTTYLDFGPAGERPGQVTEYDPPAHLGFHQTMKVRLGPLTADIDINVHYTFTQEGDSTHVLRALELSLETPGLARLLAPLIRHKFNVENRRILTALKDYAERQSTGLDESRLHSHQPPS